MRIDRHQGNQPNTGVEEFAYTEEKQKERKRRRRRRKRKPTEQETEGEVPAGAEGRSIGSQGSACHKPPITTRKV